MEILKFKPEHHQFRKKVKDFMKSEVIPHVDQWETDRMIPKSVWKQMGEEGLLCTTIKKEYGGPEKDFLHAFIFTDEIVKTNHNGLGPPTHSDIVVPYINSFGSEELKKKYLPGCVSGSTITAIAISEPGTGSDVASMSMTAEEKGDSVILNGTKTFITNGINCDLVVLAAVDPTVENPYKSISLYVVEANTPGFKKGKKLKKMGMQSQDTSELFFTDCRVPVKNRLGDKGKGFSMLMQKLQQERLIVSISAVGIAEHVFNLTADNCRTGRKSGRPTADSHAGSYELVNMATDIKLARTFLDKLILDHIKGKDVVLETSMAKFWNTEMLMRTLNGCLDLYHDDSIFDSCPIVRYCLDARVMPIFAGTNEIMKTIVAKLMKL